MASLWERIDESGDEPRLRGSDLTVARALDLLEGGKLADVSRAGRGRSAGMPCCRGPGK